MTARSLDGDLAELAALHRVAVSYQDSEHRAVSVPRDVVVAVLAQLGVAAGTDAEIRAELTRPSGPGGTLVVRAGERRRLPRPATLHTEDGGELPVSDRLPADLPPGYHRLVDGERETTLIVAPGRLATPPPLWGWMLQLYALRSAGSWGIGDYADLRRFLRWSARELGAGAVLVNPLDAITPTLPVRRSPYSPSSRRFANPLYLSIPALASDVDTSRPVSGELIDYDAVWTAKLAALERLWPGGPVSDDPELRDFATFCALAERHGADWRAWPAELRHPRSPGVARAAAELAPRIAFHTWVQHRCDEQLAAARDAAREMALGIVHDLPVGVAAEGADAWALQDVLATGVRVGAPPDAFNQQGQDWGLPPWRPDRLDATGFGALRDLLRRSLRHADGLRIDHVAWLQRLWWIPPGHPPDRGTYVGYDADAMLAVLTLEAQRAGAVVIGEDLGTMPDGLSERLHEAGIASSAVLWFERDAGGALRPPADWPELAMASISTHDLPTATGFLRGEQVRVRAELGVLGRPVGEEREQAAAQRSDLLDLLRREGLVGADPDEDEVILAMHAVLARVPSRIALAALTDVLGDPRQPNLPGTLDEYPNWRIPLPAGLEQIEVDERVRRVVAALRAARPPVSCR